MLRKLHIQNFKGWKDTGMIDLAPITVLFGSNSSGKSSIGQFLVMLKQTVRQSDRKTVLLLNGESVDLGSVSDIFYAHNLKENSNVTKYIGHKLKKDSEEILSIKSSKTEGGYNDYLCVSAKTAAPGNFWTIKKFICIGKRLIPEAGEK